MTQKQGRPSSYTPELHAEIIERLTNGEPLAQICRDPHMPASRTVSDWKAAHPTFSADFAHAREAGFDAIAMDALRIADTPVEGISEKYEPVEIANPDDPEGPKVKEFQLVERKVEDMLAHRRLQVETRLKLLSKWDPKRYGERQVLAGDPEAPLHGLTETDVDAKIAAFLAAHAGR